MEKHKFVIVIKGSKKQAATKVNALAVIGELDTKTLIALAHVVKHEPQKVGLAKQFLGV